MKTSLLCNEIVPLLGFGCMRFPQKNGTIDYEKSSFMIDYALNNGVNYFDTSYVYHNGESESFLNKVLVSRYPRHKYFLADKLPISLCRTDDDIKHIHNIQIKKLGLDYLDFHALHAVNKERWENVRRLKIQEFQYGLKENGKVKYIGFSFHDSPEVLEKILNESLPLDYIMLQINYFDWKSIINAEKMYNICTERNIPIIAMEPLRGGNLVNLPEKVKCIFSNYDQCNSIASWALRFVGSLNNVKIVLSGMSDIEHVKDNINTFSDFQPLIEDEYGVLNDVLSEISKVKMIPCTECGYCSVCPQNVDIPGAFSAYNKYKALNSTTEITKNYTNSVPLDRRIDNCTNCNTCLSSCPQHINIPATFEDIKKTIKFLQRQQKIGIQLHSYKDNGD